ncbi:MOSC domain-containing protein [uncultured Shewanella sp.]|uniref:MOSC domain-containing protein n=1 Tax=uncultured Shewanella sp. TaxID=173975 RepID=UPI00262D462F|nr:MOSC domain-containing protein [uncultured Shewanella sp.]
MIKHLFLKTANDTPTVVMVNELSLSSNGILGGVTRHEFRHLLLLPLSTLTEFNIPPGQLGENILLSEEMERDIHTYPSGTVFKIGEVLLRITFHCEPCKKIKHLASANKILHKRGVLAQVINGGNIYVGDKIKIMETTFEPIPYALADRVKWYLNKIDNAIAVTTLVDEIGLSKSYCRAIPNIIRNRTDIDATKIVFKNRR